MERIEVSVANIHALGCDSDWGRISAPFSNPLMAADARSRTSSGSGVAFFVFASK
jgi:hypothetical protein